MSSDINKFCSGNRRPDQGSSRVIQIRNRKCNNNAMILGGEEVMARKAEGWPVGRGTGGVANGEARPLN